MPGRGKREEGEALLDPEDLLLQIRQVWKVCIDGENTANHLKHRAPFCRRPDRILGIRNDLRVMCKCHLRGIQGAQSKRHSVMRRQCHGKLGYGGPRQYANNRR